MNVPKMKQGHSVMCGAEVQGCVSKQGNAKSTLDMITQNLKYVNVSVPLCIIVVDLSILSDCKYDNTHTGLLLFFFCLTCS